MYHIKIFKVEKYNQKKKDSLHKFISTSEMAQEKEAQRQNKRNYLMQRTVPLRRLGETSSRLQIPMTASALRTHM